MEQGSSLNRPRRAVLGLRDDGIERLIAGHPLDNCGDANALRAWVRNFTRDVSRWQIAKGQERVRNRLEYRGAR